MRRTSFETLYINCKCYEYLYELMIKGKHNDMIHHIESLLALEDSRLKKSMSPTTWEMMKKKVREKLKKEKQKGGE